MANGLSTPSQPRKASGKHPVRHHTGRAPQTESSVIGPDTKGYVFLDTAAWSVHTCRLVLSHTEDCSCQTGPQSPENVLHVEHAEDCPWATVPRARSTILPPLQRRQDMTSGHGAHSTVLHSLQRSKKTGAPCSNAAQQLWRGSISGGLFAGRPQPSSKLRD